MSSQQKKRINLSDIAIGIGIVAILIVLVTLYFKIQPLEDSNLIISHEFPSNEFFNAEIKVKNLSHKNHVIPNDLLRYEVMITPKRDDVKTLTGMLDITYGDEVVKKAEKYRFSFDPGVTSTGVDIPIHLENLGENLIRLQISLDEVPEELIDRDEKGEMIGIRGKTDWTVLTPIEVRSAIEIIETETLTIQYWGMFITASIGFATVIALLLNLRISHRQSEILEDQKNISKKHMEYLAMLEVMKIFNNDDNAKRRNEVYTAYAKNNLYDANNEIFDAEMRHNVASVRGAFEMMGNLVKEEYVQKEKFFDIYAESVIKMYKVLMTHIDKERKKQKLERFAINFEWLFNEASKYWKVKFPSEPAPEPYKEN